MERPYNSSLPPWYYDFSFIFRKPHVSTDLIYWCHPLYLFYDCDFHPFHSYEEWKCGSLKYISRLFIVSIIGTLDPYWTGPNILSLVLGVLVFIGGILFKMETD